MISSQFFTRPFVFFAILQCFHVMVNSAPVFNCTKVDADCIVKTADIDKDGLLSFDEGYEFLAPTFGENKTKDEILAEMKKIDLNHDGFLSAAEVDPPSHPKVIIDRALLPKVKPRGTTSVYCLLNYADQNNDGVLTYEEALILVEVPELTNKEERLAEIEKMDLNHDGFLSALEMDPSQNPLPNGSTMDLYCVTNKADKNYDGVLSSEEGYQYLAALYRNKNKSKDEIFAEMKKLDLNQDGVLSASEIFPPSLPKTV